MLPRQSPFTRQFNERVKYHERRIAREEATARAQPPRVTPRRPGTPFRPPTVKGQYAGREHLPIAGPPQFVLSVGRVLAELEAFDAGIYRLVVEHLPKAVYDLGLKAEYPNACALSDGRFAFAGDDNFDWFRFVLLHEVVHNIERAEKGSTSEQGADAIANAILAAMGLPAGGR